MLTSFQRGAAVLLSHALCGLAVLFVAGGSVGAHEVQPAVADVTLGAHEVKVSIHWTLEAPLGGIDLDGLEDTNSAENADAYDRLRRLPPDALEGLLREAWARLVENIILRAGDTEVTPRLISAEIPETGNLELPRLSTLHFSAPLPDDGTPLRIGWSRSFGPLVVRQQGVEDGYTGYLTGGALSIPIPRASGALRSATTAFFDYATLGFTHIVPRGLDHILFVLGLFFLSLKLRPLIWQVTAFTIAHTLTLALAVLGIVTIPASIVEPLIAASIVYVGIENVLSKGMSPWRPLVVFGFGLLHGLGFASVLGDIGLDPDRILIGLIGFNIGVELGQLAVIAFAYLAVGIPFGKRAWYRIRIAYPASLVIAAIGAYWLVQRTLF